MQLHAFTLFKVLHGGCDPSTKMEFFHFFAGLYSHNMTSVFLVSLLVQNIQKSCYQ